MPEKEYTFEDIDKLMQKTDIAGLEKQATAFKGAVGTATAAEVLAQICPIYRTVRPILVALTQIPFIPAKWKKAIKALIKVLDKICPG
jgi:hypothetical protein